MAHNAGGIGAQQIVRRMGPVRADDDQIGLQLAGPDQDLFIDIAAPDDVLHIRRVVEMLRREGMQTFLGAFEHLLLMILGKERPDDAHAEAGDDGHYVQLAA